MTSVQSSAPTTALESPQIGGDHYRQSGMQPVLFIQANRLGFCEGSIIKYVARHKLKGGADDLKKARQYIDMLLELEYGVSGAAA